MWFELQKPAPVKAAPVSVYNWTGCYVGGNAGGIWGHDTAHVVVTQDNAGQEAAAIAGGAGWAAVHRIGGLVNTGWERNALICVGAGLLMSAIYIGFLKLMRVGELDDLLRPLLRRVRRSA